MYLFIDIEGGVADGSFDDMQHCFWFGVEGRWGDLMIKIEKLAFLSFEVVVEGVEDEGDWEEFEGVDFIEFTELKYIFEEVLFVGDLLVVFEMVENLSNWFFGCRIFVEVASIALLPLEREAKIFAVGDFLPLFAGGHDFPDEM